MALGLQPFTVGELSGPKLACLPKGCAASGAVDFSWVRRGGAWHSKRPSEMTKSIHVGGRPVWAEISLKAILRNLEIIRKHVNGGARGDQSKKSRQDAGATRDERQNR